MIRRTFLSLTAAAFLAVPAHAQEKDIVDTAVGAGNFTTLVAAVQAAGLVDTLKGEGPFTVFAPSDAAFAKLPPGTLEALLADKENGAVASLPDRVGSVPPTNGHSIPIAGSFQCRPRSHSGA